MPIFKDRTPTIDCHKFITKKEIYKYITKKEIENSVDRQMEERGYDAVENLLIEEGKITQTPPSNPLKFMYRKFLTYRKEKIVRKEIRMRIYRSIKRGLAHERDRERSI